MSRLSICTLAAALSLVLAAPSALLASERSRTQGPSHTQTQSEAQTQSSAAPRIQLALLLDTSSSMDGLIDQARGELWTIVNELARATRDGVQPELEVALYEYGNDGLSEQSGYIRQHVAFTRDLDRVSEALFALTTNGGSEYCGAAMDRALDELEWSTDPADLRVLYIAGNEPFSQGPVDFRQVASEARQRDIRINTLHCGDPAQGVSGFWQAGALLAGGAYLSIDQGRAVTEIPAPQDADIAALNRALNETYVPYGVQGKEGLERQRAQDARSLARSPATLSKRAIAKSNGARDSRSWDLIDGVVAGEVDLEQLEPDLLPEEMRDLSAEQKKEHVEEKRLEREQIQGKILELQRARDAYVSEQRREELEQAPTLGEAVRKSIQEQARSKDYSF